MYVLKGNSREAQRGRRKMSKNGQKVKTKDKLEAYHSPDEKL